MQQLSCDLQFSKSVEEFVNQVKDPKKFLADLSELMYYLHQLVKDDSTINDHSLWELSLVIPHVATPLVQGGPEVIENTKNGIIELADVYDALNFDKDLRLVLIAISKYSDACILNRNDLEVVQILCDLSACIYTYEREQSKEAA